MDGLMILHILFNFFIEEDITFIGSFTIISIKMNNLQSTLIVLLIVSAHSAVPNTAGFDIGKVKEYKVLKKEGTSTLYEIDCPQIQDGRPMKLIELKGSHYEVGYAYASMLGNQMVDTYHTFLNSQFSNPIELKILEIFLDWQYDNLIVTKIPTNSFFQEMKGIHDSGVKVHKNNRLRLIVQRTLVFSSYPGDFNIDIMYAMLNAFLEKGLKITNPTLLNFVENNLFKLAKMYTHFMNKWRIHCSFMAAWGSKTKGGKLYTMRNLDWSANTGLNKNKLIFIWKVKDTIPHATIGFPGVIGALTGISQAGITVHEAGLDSMKATELGFQWTLRLRYILMKAHNLAESRQIWKNTENTFGMNHMIASAADVPTGQTPVFVVETMRGYNAFFTDKDPREDGTKFIDPTSKHSYQAGFAVKDAVYRTNHAYDPTINKFRAVKTSEHGSTMHRYMVLKDSVAFYTSGQIGQLEALNITANVAHKGGPDLYRCPQPGKDTGTNIMSVMFVPGEQRMYAAIEYGSGNTYRTACCGVYLDIDLEPWFGRASHLESEDKED